MGSKVKEEATRSLIRREAPDILLIQETKMEDKEFLQISKKIWKGSSGHAVSALGASRGLGSLWNPLKYRLVSDLHNTHWLFLKLQPLDSGEAVNLFNVYVPTNIEEKRECWDSIRQLSESENLENVIVAGYLNLTMCMEEKRGGTIIRDLVREWVEDLMQDWDLLDIPQENGKYTWSNKRIGPGHIVARLDRCLVQSSFLLVGLESRLHILPCSASNHKPILLEMLGHKDFGPIPFRFNPLWGKEPVFLKLVQDCWNFPVKDAKITKEVLDKEAELQQIFHKAFLSEEEHWRQKSRSLWFKAGDRNSAFFHKQAQARKSFNSIAEIKDGNSIHKDFDSIKRVAFNHFQNLYREEGVTDPNSKFWEAVPPRISPSMNQQLEANISVQEIKDALSDMEPDKAPGPDGFIARFLQTCWQIVEKYLYKMILKSQTFQKIGGSTNSTFLALIPKEKVAKEFNRFCPISLYNIGYKLITKVIANRLKGILPAIIPENQGGFVQGRQLADNFILVQEAIHSSQLRKEKGMVIKLDLANAFDRVRLSFLWEVLKKFGFGMGFLKWIHACIVDPWITPLVNGRAAGFFKALRGLRQGCPSLCSSSSFMSLS
eukprot:PITA_08466